LPRAVVVDQFKEVVMAPKLKRNEKLMPLLLVVSLFSLSLLLIALQVAQK
jgi:hypothetical protein